MKKIILTVVAICVSGIAVADQAAHQRKREQSQQMVEAFISKCNYELEQESLGKSSGVHSFFVVQNPTEQLVWEPIKKQMQFASLADYGPALAAIDKAAEPIIEHASIKDHQTTFEDSVRFLKTFRESMKQQGGEVQDEIESSTFNPKDPSVRKWLDRAFVFNELRERTKKGAFKCTNQMTKEVYEASGLEVSKLERCYGAPVKALPLVIAADTLTCDGQIFTASSSIK